MTDINFKTNTRGKAFIVDPNPPNNETIPLEDMFIYVKFSAYPRSRTTYNGTDLSGDDQFLNFEMRGKEFKRLSKAYGKKFI